MRPSPHRPDAAATPSAGPLPSPRRAPPAKLSHGMTVALRGPAGVGALAALLALATPALPAGAQPPAQPQIPRTLFLVINNSAVPVACASRIEGRAWSGYVAIAAGSEWSVRAEKDEKRRDFFCAAPVERRVFSVMVGERYSLLPEPGSDRIILTRVTVPVQ